MSTIILNDVAKDQKLVLDYKRELDQKHKWVHGEADLDFIPGRLSKRPAKPRRSGTPRTFRSSQRDVAFHNVILSKLHRKHDPLHGDISTSDSSAEEDIQEASAAPEPDAGISYSFDAPRGPHQGSHILGVALAKAVEKFEIQATEKLVKEEYEIVGKEKDNRYDGYVADEDDFELV